jgi:uncharacterized protein (DUF2062 family)
MKSGLTLRTRDAMAPNRSLYRACRTCRYVCRRPSAVSHSTLLAAGMVVSFYPGLFVCKKLLKQSSQ